jgi:hypothetical protein
MRCIDFALVGSEKFVAKRSEKKINFFSRERAKRISFRFEAKKLLKRNRRTLVDGIYFGRPL